MGVLVNHSRLLGPRSCAARGVRSGQPREDQEAEALKTFRDKVAEDLGKSADADRRDRLANYRMICALTHRMTRPETRLTAPKRTPKAKRLADEYAYAVALLSKFIQVALPRWWVLGQAKASPPETSALLRMSKLDQGFA
jgi:hypothetical protein